MSVRLLNSTAIIAITMLSACGGSSSKSSTPEMTDTMGAFLAEAEAANGTIARIAGDEFDNIAPLPGSKFTAIPDTGSVTFTGPGRIDIFERSVSATGGFTSTTEETVVGFQGTSVIDVNFSEQTFAGRLDDLTAFDPSAIDAAAANGSLTISGNSGAGVPNDLAGTYVGSVEGFGTSYDLSGNLTGKLRGTRVNPGTQSPIKALSLVGSDNPIVESPLLVDIVIVGEN